MVPRIWIDGDSVARDARQLAERHADRRGYKLIIVADRAIRVAETERVELIEVEKGSGAVDDYLLKHAAEEELVITRDIPLAEKLLAQGCFVLNDRGEEFTAENIGKRLSERDMMLVLRESGAVASRGASYGRKDLKRFADAFDIFITKRLH